MAQKNELKDLIVIEGKELWGLLAGCRDKRQRYQLDFDYISKLRTQLKSENAIKSLEAKTSLLFLNAEVLASLDGNFSELEQLGISPSDEFKRKVYSSRNAAQRDFLSNNQGAECELTDLLEPASAMTLSDLVEMRKATKKALRKAGKSCNPKPIIADKKPKPKKAPKQRPINPGNAAMNETIEQFLARGGKITPHFKKAA